MHWIFIYKYINKTYHPFRNIIDMILIYDGFTLDFSTLQ